MVRVSQGIVVVLVAGGVSLASVGADEQLKVVLVAVVWPAFVVLPMGLSKPLELLLLLVGGSSWMGAFGDDELDGLDELRTVCCC